MKIKELSVSDRFTWNGKKYSVFLKLKKDPGKSYKIPCMEWPQGGCLDMPSNRIVKPIMRIENVS